MDDINLRTVMSVGELTSRIAALLEDAFPFVWVQGEISGLAAPSSGHIYFTLKDDAAQIRVVLFKNQARALGLTGAPPPAEPSDGGGPTLFSEPRRGPERPAWRPGDGQHVLVMGRIGVYGPRGEYQVIADHVEPVGVGAMMLALEQLKQRLSQKGYFAPERKRKLPYLPNRIAVVTSGTGAALFDILKVVFGRMPNSRVLVVPVRVQGEGAEHEIARAVGLVNRMGLADVMIVGRGGGSLEDLWAFNTEVVADALFASEIPVISAVGHEIDITIADLVADVRAATPTAAAELVTPRLDDLLLTLDGIQQRLTARMEQLISRHRERFAALVRLLRSPRRDLDRLRMRLAAASSLLGTATDRGISGRRADLSSLSHALTRLSPEAVLARGYSITERAEDGTIIRSVSDIDVGRAARIRLHRGILIADVIRKEPDETS
jgi:exodeoxyribonuclease VII large subunit